MAKKTIKFTFSVLCPDKTWVSNQSELAQTLIKRWRKFFLFLLENSVTKNYFDHLNVNSLCVIIT